MRYVWIVVTSLVVVVAAGLPFLLSRDWAPQVTPEAGPPLLREGEHYYVLLSVIEVAARDANGEAWDKVGEEAPDLFYEIRWQDQKVFEASVKDDTLVAKWSNVAVDLGDVIHAVSLDDSIKAARITARAGEVLEFVVYDHDVTSDDLIGRWTVPVTDLRVGDQKWSEFAGELVSVTCRVLPLETVGFESLTK
ncbi:MAG: hypothetical protein ACYTDU_01840 [Planctomycetota bacterium]|jgi:hypothetical protein